MHIIAFQHAYTHGHLLGGIVPTLKQIYKFQRGIGANQTWTGKNSLQHRKLFQLDIYTFLQDSILVVVKVSSALKLLPIGLIQRLAEVIAGTIRHFYHLIWFFSELLAHLLSSFSFMLITNSESQCWLYQMSKE